MAGWCSAASSATLKIDRAGWPLQEDAPYAPGTLTPPPEIYASKADGTIAHLQNWDRLHPQPPEAERAHRVAHKAARTSHLANASLRAGKPVRWNSAEERIES